MAKATVPLTRMPLKAWIKTLQPLPRLAPQSPALPTRHRLGGNSPQWVARGQEAIAVPQALGVLVRPTQRPWFPSPAQPSPAALGASP